MKAPSAVRLPRACAWAAAPNVGPSGPKDASGVGTGENVLVSWFMRAATIFSGMAALSARAG